MIFFKPILIAHYKKSLELYINQKQNNTVMKNEELYHKTVDILVQAYFNDTLAHSDCSACAVGNIVAANTGIVFEKCKYSGSFYWKDNEGPFWGNLFHTDSDTKEQIFDGAYLIDEKVLCEIKSTGYNVYDLMKIEYAFETALKGKSSDEWMFNGLMAVIEVLDQIHENENKEVTNISKQKFQKQIH